MKDYTPLNIEVRAKPRSARAKARCATVTVTYGMTGDGCPSRPAAMHAAEAPRVLLDFVQRVATAESAEDLYEAQADARTWLRDNAVWLPAEEAREGREDTDHG